MSRLLSEAERSVCIEAVITAPYKDPVSARLLPLSPRFSLLRILSLPHYHSPCPRESLLLALAVCPFLRLNHHDASANKPQCPA